MIKERGDWDEEQWDTYCMPIQYIDEDTAYDQWRDDCLNNEENCND